MESAFGGTYFGLVESEHAAAKPSATRSASTIHVRFLVICDPSAAKPFGNMTAAANGSKRR